MDRSSARRTPIDILHWRIGSLALAVAIPIGLSTHTGAVEQIDLQIADVLGTHWNAKDVSAALTLSPQGISLARLSIAQLKLSEELGTLKNVSISCDQPLIAPPKFRCPNARISGSLGKLGKQNFRADVTYHNAEGSLAFALRGLKVAAGTVELEGHWRETGWTAKLAGDSLNVKDLAALAQPWFTLPEGFAAAGSASVHLVARGSQSLQNAQIELKTQALTANNAEGTLATDQLTFNLKATIEPAGPDWNIDGQLHVASGQAYLDPVFADFGNNALAATLKGRWLAQSKGLQIERLQFDQKALAKGNATGRITFGEQTTIDHLNLELATVEFPGAYTTLLQPFLLDTEFKDFETSGRLSGTLSLQDTAPAALDLTFSNVTAKDKAGRLGIRELQGRLVWLSSARRTIAGAADTDTQSHSHLLWKGANAYGLTGGSARIDFTASGPDFLLLKPTVLPILDGGLAIQTLDLRDFGRETMSVRFNAQLRPISMALLSKAFGWPEFGGSIEGRIPEVNYNNKILSVGGALEARVFDGHVVVNDLQLRNPLSNYPRLNAGITLRNLDLEAVTGTFSFGTITGRLDGDIRDLELFRWAPVRMDLRLYTPTNDRSSHLISQRAVNNLSNIGGGGVTAALQSGFLRFFKNFRYRRLGISCRLANDICRMDGIERAAGSSYYIVKGSSIPRIDIIGNARQVDWPRLVAQLQAIQESGGAVVE